MGYGQWAMGNGLWAMAVTKSKAIAYSQTHLPARSRQSSRRRRIRSAQMSVQLILRLAIRSATPVSPAALPVCVRTRGLFAVLLRPGLPDRSGFSAGLHIGLPLPLPLLAVLARSAAAVLLLAQAQSGVRLQDKLRLGVGGGGGRSGGGGPPGPAVVHLEARRAMELRIALPAEHTVAVLAAKAGRAPLAHTATAATIAQSGERLCSACQCRWRNRLGCESAGPNGQQQSWGPGPAQGHGGLSPRGRCGAGTGARRRGFAHCQSTEVVVVHISGAGWPRT